MNRRSFITSALKATATGLIVPEWILDPPKGRGMVAVPSFSDCNAALDFRSFRNLMIAAAIESLRQSIIMDRTDAAMMLKLFDELHGSRSSST